MKKILLITPDKTTRETSFDKLKYPPLGLTTLASVLKQKGFISIIFDASVENPNPFEKIRQLILKESIFAIGISFTSDLAESAYLYSDKLKSEFPDIPIIAGGYHPTVMHTEVVSYNSIDYVVVGEGEITFPLLLKALAEKTDIAEINGISYMKDGKAVTTSPPSLIKDIDSIPIPSYGLLKLNHYTSPTSRRKPFLTMIRSRGCPYNCLFCGVNAIFSYKFRCQSPQRTLEEIKHVVKEFKTKEISFKDSDFLIDHNNVTEFCNLLIKNELDLTWNCSTRIDSVNKDILTLMKRAGCRQITFGIESGSQRMLNALRKNLSVKQISKSIRITKECGITCIGGFIVGNPGEDHETLNETLRLIEKLDLDYASFSFLTAFPGSDLYNLAIQNKWFLESNKSMEYKKMSINASKLTDEELKKAMRIMIKKFYFRPRYILKRLKRLTLNEMLNNITGAYSLLARLISGNCR